VIVISMMSELQVTYQTPGMRHLMMYELLSAIVHAFDECFYC
jgi:hypothetical protein